MEIVEKEAPTEFEKVGARVKRIVKVKNEALKFALYCMEVIKLETEMNYFIGQPNDEGNKSIY